MRFEEGKLLSTLSTFGIGGPARYFLEVATIPMMQEALSYCKNQQLPFLVIGKGSNSLFDDRGFNGLCILNKINFCEFQEPDVYVGAGYSFSLLGVQSARKGLAGLEFASGIPASVGGAIFMNAGASGGETRDCLEEIEFVTRDGELKKYRRSEVEFSYRTSSFQTMQGAIVAARFRLHQSEEARKKQLTIIEYRTKTQPYSDKSVGCIFRNPEGGSAGALIEKSGLKGFAIGDAQVSELHANFIVNKGEATAENVLELASLVQKTVLDKMGIHLEMEVRSVPYQL